MTLPPPPVYQDANGTWFFRCGRCSSFDGGFQTEVLATLALMRHRERHA